jgi:hypothetical protein
VPTYLLLSLTAVRIVTANGILENPGPPMVMDSANTCFQVGKFSRKNEMRKTREGAQNHGYLHGPWEYVGRKSLVFRYCSNRFFKNIYLLSQT